MSRWKLKRQPVDRLLKTIMVAAALTGGLHYLDFPSLEAKFYDFRMTHGPQPDPSKDITIIAIDHATLEALDDFAPLGLDFHTKILESLEDYRPKAIGYLVNMNHVNQVNPDFFSGTTASRFVQAANRFQSTGVPFMFGTPFDINGEVIPPYPLSSLDHSIAIIHRDGNVFSEDGVSRRAILKLYDRPTFHLDLLQKAEMVDRDFIPSAAFKDPEVDADYFHFQYHQDPVQFPYRKYSAIDLVNRQVPADHLHQKTILVGTSVRENPSDFVRSPYHRDAATTPKLTLHANILDSIMRDTGLIRAPLWISASLNFVANFFVIWWVVVLTPLAGVFSTLALTAGIFLGSMVLFKIGSTGIWMPLDKIFVGIFLSYYIAVPYRLIREYKRRWNYQRKNEILMQVEELKTNFLRLVTHDLKTPVARIQGLAEVILRKSRDRLHEKDVQSLGSIVDSTDELNRFISSILELSKLETDQLRLQLESKDVNLLLERSVEQFKAQSRSKKIKLQTELEPLFPIKIDPNLITKVFNNLIDNAIKYSPEHSTVTIRSFENDEYVGVAVSDQGIGIDAEEIERIFSKFYRAKTDTSHSVSGSGLGLYLTRYFVEAHHGKVELVSRKGEGSTFTIYLPLELNADKPGLTVKRGISQKKEMSPYV